MHDSRMSGCRTAVVNLFLGKDHMENHESNQRSGQRGQQLKVQVREFASKLPSSRFP